MGLIDKINDVISGKTTFSESRSPQWPTVRSKFIKINNTCAACGGKSKLEVHHKQPFHIHPELELDPSNFITLCEDGKNGINCHLLIGHLGNYRSMNKDVDSDAKTWNEKITTRPVLDPNT